jgi:hypothetical protein
MIWMQILIPLGLAGLGFVAGEKDKIRWALLNLILGFVATTVLGLQLGLRDVSNAMDVRNRLAGIDDPILEEYADEMIREFEGRAASLAEGWIELTGEAAILDAYYRSLDQVGEGDVVYAVNRSDPGQVWNGPRGPAALERNREAINRGARIVRIFIYGDTLEFSRLIEIARRHKEIGVDVFTVKEADLAPDQREDFLVTSTNTLARFRLDATRGIDQGRISRIRSEVLQWERKFSEIRAKSQPLD